MGNDELYRSIVENCADFVFVASMDGRCAFANAAARAVLGLDVTHDVYDIVHADDREAARSNFARATGGEERTLRYRVQRAPDVWCWLEVCASPITYRGTPHILAIARDVTAQRRAGQREALQLAIAHVLADAVDLAAIATTVLDTICTSIGCDVGELWSFDDESSGVRCAAQWQSPALEGLEFATITRSITLPPGVGLPGSVWQRDEPVWISDVANDPSFARAAEAAAAGLHMAVGCPIRYRNQLLAVLVILSRAVVEPDRETLETLHAVGHQIAQFIARQRVEAHYRSSLHEKEMLISEIHHRVKNNLQLVISLLALQSDQLEPSYPGVASAFVETQLRIQTMALIHETLYRTGNVTHVQLGPHVEQICAQIYRSFAIDPGRVALSVEIADVSMGLDIALPCGLLINELVANALKHAFPDGRRGTVSVDLTTSVDRINLVVRDDGVGLPPGLDPLATETLGLQLIRDLAEQLRATLSIDREHGTAFRFGVPYLAQELR